MKNDYWLLHEALDTFQRLRHWIDPDYYREQVMPTVRKIKDRLAIIETNRFLEEKKQRYENFQPPKEEKKPQLPEFKYTEPHELDTVPNKLIEATTNFGLFNDGPISENCKKDSNAPHRYLKDLSLAMGRYVCECEFWEPK